MLVPYSMACSVWKVPFLPVMPWQITRVLLSTKTAGEAAEKWRRPWWRREAIEDSNLVRACLAISLSQSRGCDFRAAILCLSMSIAASQIKTQSPKYLPPSWTFYFSKNNNNI